MEVVQVWGEAESFNGSLDVFLDVGCFVRNAAFAEAIEATFGGDLSYVSESWTKYQDTWHTPKTLSRTLCFLMNSPKSFSLTPIW